MWEAESVCAAGAGRGAGGRGRLEGRGGAPRLVAVQGADVREKLDRARLEAPVLQGGCGEVCGRGLQATPGCALGPLLEEVSRQCLGSV